MSKANSDWPNALKPHEAMMYVSLGSATSLLFLFLLKFLSFFCTLIISAVYNTYWSDYCITCILLKDLLLISLLFFFFKSTSLEFVLLQNWSSPIRYHCMWIACFVLWLCEEIFLLVQTMSSSRSQTVPCLLGRRECRLSQSLVVIERSEPRHEQAICLSRWNILWHSARHWAIMLQLLVVRY